MAPACVTRRFVLLSYARSGTSTLIRGIGSHPACYAHREIFNDGSSQSVLPEAQAALDLAALRATPLAYARALLDYSPGPSCVGFKMMLGQAPEACEALMRDVSVHKIVLERENRLASFSSMLQARQTGVFHAPNARKMAAHKARAQPLRFDAAAFARHVTRVAHFYRSYRRHSAGPVLELSYTALSPALLDQVQAFLGLEPQPLDLPLPKMGGPDILARFAPQDHAEIRAALAALGHPDWITEPPAPAL